MPSLPSSASFAWPLALLALLLLPLLVAGYVAMLRRRRRRAVPYSSVALLRAAAPAPSSWRRHAPVALLLLALAALTVAVARPQARMDVPVSGSAVILALDVSGSMCSTDVEPNRLSAAQDAVRRFIKDQNNNTRIGLVVFSGSAQIAVAPTKDRDQLERAVDSLTTGRGTTIGAAILKSVDAIAEIDSDVAPAGVDGTGTDAGDSAIPAPGGPKTKTAPEIVVLLTDGANTAGVEPVDAAKVAAARGVRVYPIGFGTTNPTRMVCTAEQLGGDSFGGPGGPGFGGPGFGGGAGPGRSFLVVDEDTLRQVAQITGGTYHAAEGADQLQGVLKDLPRHVQASTKDVEITVLPAGLAILLLLLSMAAAVRWSTFPA